MKQSLVKQAASAFKQGKYAVALDFYRQAGELLGQQNFKANIWLCENHFKKSRLQAVCSDIPLKNIKVACIMDEFTFHCYKPECQLLPLTPDKAIDELVAFNPDLLFIESAWRGKDELWTRKIGSLSQELKEVLRWCRDKQVPTVFWNKEDPIHFETFLTTARQFDYIFTTDIDCISRYKAALGHDRVYLLPFACQPKTHNPIELYPRKDAFCFAGAYYVRYPERTRDLAHYINEFSKFKPVEIFDRNFGKNDVNYQFPPEYQPYIVGTLPFNEIDKAYKGYQYSINLNSIKQSQTMFARRVYELLGSNTVTVSNFSRGVRLLFGDLVIASDSGEEIVKRLQLLDEESSKKLRLAALRKVMLEHSYEHRLAYVARKALAWRGEYLLPLMLVVACAQSEDECRWVIENYQRQRHVRKQLLMFVKDVQFGTAWGPSADDSIKISQQPSGLAATNFHTHVGPHDWVAVMDVNDYYGPNYLLDLAIATRYSPSPVVGKAERFRYSNNSIDLLAAGHAYQLDLHLPVRASAIQAEFALGEPTLLSALDRQVSGYWELPGFAIDAFNYCEGVRCASELSAVRTRVDDLQIDSGIPIDELLNLSEGISAATFDESTSPKWNAAKLHEVFGQIGNSLVCVSAELGGLRIESSLADGKHEYLYAKQDLLIDKLPCGKEIATYLDATPGLDLQYVIIFLDNKMRKIGHVIKTANCNHNATMPSGTAFVRLGWRVSGPGVTTVKCLLWAHRKLEVEKLLGRSDTLLLTNHYPSYDDIYRNGFVHSRVRAYTARGQHVDVFRFRLNQMVSFDEFQNVDVITGGKGALSTLLKSGRYKRVLVHFLSSEMWEVLECFPTLQCIVWVHGVEIQPWHRRDYNYRDEAERNVAKLASKKRMDFWCGILNPMSPNLKLVFVSQYFAEEVFEDIGFRLSEDKYDIIHNPIDTNLFAYHPKPVEQRKKILSIRPYATRTYANDLSVKAILELSRRPQFKELEFRMIGDGVLFEETLEPLRDFRNVTIERRFLTQQQIADLHKEYGVFLVPTRMDSQGVSRDEAMSSGLVPITNKVAAIPEFVSSECGVLAGPEDWCELANGIIAIYENPELFSRLSEAAAHRVLKQTNSIKIIEMELSLINK